MGIRAALTFTGDAWKDEQVQRRINGQVGVSGQVMVPALSVMTVQRSTAKTNLS